MTSSKRERCLDLVESADHYLGVAEAIAVELAALGWDRTGGQLLSQVQGLANQCADRICAIGRIVPMPDVVDGFETIAGALSGCTPAGAVDLVGELRVTVRAAERAVRAHFPAPVAIGEEHDGGFRVTLWDASDGDSGGQYGDPR